MQSIQVQAIQVQVTSIFGRLKAGACTVSEINLNPSLGISQELWRETLPLGTHPMVPTKIFGNIHCLSHSSSHGFLFFGFGNPVKKSLRSLSLAPLSPQHHSQTGVPLGSCRVSVENSYHPSSLDFSSSERCCYRRLRSGEARGLVLLLFYSLGSASVELSGEVLAPRCPPCRRWSRPCNSYLLPCTL